MIKVLVISRAPWRNDNSVGNTCSFFFQDMKDMEFYSLCMRAQPPQNDIALRNFYISEGQLVKNLLHRTPIGAENASSCDSVEAEQRVYAQAKKKRSVLLSFVRELLWTMGRWKNSNLKQYLDDIKPDVIFFPVFGCFYPHKILKYIHSLTNASVVLFHADDNYTLRQFSLSPFYWIYRLILRKWVRNSVRMSAINYVISDIQKQDYEKAFQKECKILTKSADFSEPPQLKGQYNTPLQLVFTGNIGTNRWKSLAIIAKALQAINADGGKAQLRIYTATPLTEKMKTALEIPETSFIMGAVPADEIWKLQSDADMLVHVEGLDRKSRLTVRQSFSTKLVDYFKAARPIVVVGPHDVASIVHLIEHDCAIVAENADELTQKLSAVLQNAEELNMLAEKAYACGKACHDKASMQKMLHTDLLSLK